MESWETSPEPAREAKEHGRVNHHAFGRVQCHRMCAHRKIPCRFGHVSTAYVLTIAFFGGVDPAQLVKNEGIFGSLPAQKRLNTAQGASPPFACPPNAPKGQAQIAHHFALCKKEGKLNSPFHIRHHQGGHEDAHRILRAKAKAPLLLAKRGEARFAPVRV